MQRRGLCSLLIVAIVVLACGGDDGAEPMADASTTLVETEPDDELCATVEELDALKQEIWADEDLLDMSTAEVEQLVATLDDAYDALEVVRTSLAVDDGTLLERWQQVYAALARGYRALEFDVARLDDPDAWEPFEEAWSHLAELSGDEFEPVVDAFVDEIVERCGFVPFAGHDAVDGQPPSASGAGLPERRSAPVQDGDVDEESTDDSAAAEVPQVAVQFVELAAEQSPRTVGALTDLTVDGSPAAAYAHFIAGQTLANHASGFTVDPWRVTVADGNINVCDGTCTRYDSFEVEGGLLATFAVDGHPLAGRIAGPSQPIDTAHGTVQVTSAYEATPKSSLVITFAVEATHNIFVWAAKAEYAEPGGARKATASWVGPHDVRSESTGWFAVVVPAAELGGVLYVELQDYGLDDVEVALPIG